jgi:hypothetical protein
MPRVESRPGGRRPGRHFLKNQGRAGAPSQSSSPAPRTPASPGPGETRALRRGVLRDPSGRPLTPTTRSAGRQASQVLGCELRQLIASVDGKAARCREGWSFGNDAAACGSLQGQMLWGNRPFSREGVRPLLVTVRTHWQHRQSSGTKKTFETRGMGRTEILQCRGSTCKPRWCLPIPIGLP